MRSMLFENQIKVMVMMVVTVVVRMKFLDTRREDFIGGVSFVLSLRRSARDYTW